MLENNLLVRNIIKLWIKQIKVHLSKGDIITSLHKIYQAFKRHFRILKRMKNKRLKQEDFRLLIGNKDQIKIRGLIALLIIEVQEESELVGLIYEVICDYYSCCV